MRMTFGPEQRPSLPQALSNTQPRRIVPLHVARLAARRDLAENSGPLPQRTAWDPRDVGPPTAPIPAPPIRSEPPRFTAEVGGCVECGHVQRVHERGRDTSIPCTAPGCDCLGFVDGRALPWSAIAWGVFAVVLAVVAVVLLVIGEGGNAFVTGSVAAVSWLFAWIYSAPNHHGGR